MKKEPLIIKGGTFGDERGRLTFFNDFDMKRVKRFYAIEPAENMPVRAWQGHQKEEKWFYVISGKFMFSLVQPDDWKNPSSELQIKSYLMAERENQILYVPGGYANGFKALEPGSKVMVFSSFSVEESIGDDFRFEKNLWVDWNTSKIKI